MDQQPPEVPKINLLVYEREDSKKEGAAMDPNAPGGGRIERIAGWVGSGLVSAFFSSLERCSCINLSTMDKDDDMDDEEAHDRPLLPVNREPMQDPRWDSGSWPVHSKTYPNAVERSDAVPA